MDGLADPQTDKSSYQQMDKQAVDDLHLNYNVTCVAKTDQLRLG